jgi:hypothetical protein
LFTIIAAVSVEAAAPGPAHDDDEFPITVKTALVFPIVVEVEAAVEGATTVVNETSDDDDAI